MLRTLESFGLKRVDAEVYIYLAKKGPQKAKDLADALKIRKRQLYPILNKLQAKGVVIAIHKQTTVFSALDFEKTLDQLVKQNAEQEKAIKKILEEL